jgi:Mn-dependent DtxR family transcriptional regulator
MELHEKIVACALQAPLLNLAEVARSIGHSRPAVSRCVHNLEQKGILTKTTQGWELTLQGKDKTTVLATVSLRDNLVLDLLKYSLCLIQSAIDVLCREEKPSQE